MSTINKKYVPHTLSKRYKKSRMHGKKLMDSTKINKLGWSAKISLEKGVKETINEFYNINKNTL